MVQARDILEKAGHVAQLPKHAEEYASEERSAESQEESAENKIADDLIRDYYNKIAKADAILVVNEAKNRIDNYIGGHVFLEMGFAHVLGKKIYLLNDIPEVAYKAEIVAMQPVVFNGELENINEVG